MHCTNSDPYSIHAQNIRNWHTYTCINGLRCTIKHRMDILFLYIFLSIYLYRILYYAYVHILVIDYKLGVFVKSFYTFFFFSSFLLSGSACFFFLFGECHNCNCDFWFVSSGFLHSVDVRVFQFLRRFILSLIGAVSLQHGVPIDFHQHRLFQLKSVLTQEDTKKQTHNNEIHKL